MCQHVRVQISNSSASVVALTALVTGSDGIPVPTRPGLFFKYPTRPDPKIENDWVPGNKISFESNKIQPKMRNPAN